MSVSGALCTTSRLEAAFSPIPAHATRSSRDVAIRLIDEANVGLAPGSAFGAGGEGHLRLYFARKAEDLDEAVRRLSRALA